jgi:hypothetical protein
MNRPVATGGVTRRYTIVDMPGMLRICIGVRYRLRAPPFVWVVGPAVRTRMHIFGAPIQIRRWRYFSWRRNLHKLDTAVINAVQDYQAYTDGVVCFVNLIGLLSFSLRTRFVRRMSE